MTLQRSVEQGEGVKVRFQLIAQDSCLVSMDTRPTVIEFPLSSFIQS